MTAKTAAMRKATLDTDDGNASDEGDGDLALKDDPAWTLTVTRGLTIITYLFISIQMTSAHHHHLHFTLMFHLYVCILVSAVD